MNRTLLTTGVLLVVTFLVAGAATAQEELEDPTCAADPEQKGCESPEGNGDHPPCPTDLHGQALEEGGVFMSWTLNSRSDIKVYRAVGDGDFEEIDHLEFPTTKYIDHDTEPDVTYRYQVTAVGMHQDNESRPAEGESPACETLEVTAVPVFSGFVPMIAAVAVGVVGYAMWRRR